MTGGPQRGGLTDNDLLFPIPQPLPDELGPRSCVFRVKDPLFACVLGGEGGKVKMGKDATLGVFELLNGVEWGIAWDPMII